MWRLTCACGWETTGTEEVVVSEAQEHGRILHNMAVTPEQAMAMAVEMGVSDA